MAWTTPRTWTVGEVVTAALVNTHLRDNLNYLHDRFKFGSAAMTWPGASQGSGQLTVAHGLGSTPTAYGAIVLGLGNPDFVYGSASPDATNIYLTGWNPVGVQGAGAKTIYWWAALT